MVYTDTEVIDKTLPYGTNSDDILALIEAIKMKQGNDKGIKQVYGKSNIENSKKVLKIIDISSDGLNLTDEGKEYAYETDTNKKQLILLKLLLRYPAYEYFLLNISKEKLLETPLEEIQNYWGKNSYGTSEYNRNDASSTFAKLLELAGLGNFKLGRKGKSTRIEWNDNAEKLIRDTYGQISSDDNEEIDDLYQLSNKESLQLNIDPWLDSNIKTTEQKPKSSSLNSNDKETELIKEVLEQSFSKETNKSLSNINISVNIDMTNWGIDQITSFFKATQGIFEDDDKL